MTKKNLLFLVIAIAALGVAYLVYTQSQANKLTNEAMREFDFKETASLDEIILESNDSIVAHLVKKGENWWVNNNFKVRTDRLENFFYTVENIRVKYNVPKKTQETVLKNLGVRNTKVQLISGGKVVKSYLIGGPDQNHTGTYALLLDPSSGQPAELPFVVHIQGFEGFLTPRFNPELSSWRDITVFSHPKNDIQKVELTYTVKPERSFRIEKTENSYQLFVQNQLKVVNQEDIKSYLTRFKLLSAESVITQKAPEMFEKFKKMEPLFTLTVTDVNGGVETIKGFPKKADPGQTNLAGQPIQIDPDRFYALGFNDTELLTLQYFAFDGVLKESEYFE